MSLSLSSRVFVTLLFATSPIFAQSVSGDVPNSTSSTASPAGPDGTNCESYQIDAAANQSSSNLIPFGGTFVFNLQSVFTSDGIGARGGAVYFDLSTSRMIRLDTIGLNTPSDGRPIACEIFFTDEGGDVTTSRSVPGDWRSVGFASGIGSGLDEKSILTLDEPQYLAPGTYGVAIVAQNFEHAYTTGNGSNQSFSISQISNVQIDLGAASDTPFTAPFLDSRVANVELGYFTMIARSVASTFVSDRVAPVGAANYFDVSSDSQHGITGISVNAAEPAGTPLTLAIYSAPADTSYIGNETNAALWTRVATARGLSAGLDSESQLFLDRGFTFNPRGRDGYAQGFAVVAEDFSLADSTGTNRTFQGSGLTIELGSATDIPFSGSVLPSRVANLRLVHASPGTRFNNNARYQTLLFSNRINQTGAITGLAFASSGSSELRYDRLQVRMAELPVGSALSSNFASNLPNPVLVFDSNGPFGPVQHVWPVEKDSWMEIGLQRPFQYAGGNLVVELVIHNREVLLNGSGFRRGPTSSPIPRVHREGWTTLPTIGTNETTGGLRTRLDFGCSQRSRFGVNCGGLEIHATGDASLGSSIDLSSGVGLSAAPTVLHLDLDNSSIFPLTLQSVGAPECIFHCEATAAISLTSDAHGITTSTLAVPNDPNLTGARLYGQHLQLNNANPGGVSASGYVRVVLGAAR